VNTTTETTTPTTITNIAQVAHETNRAYCVTRGDWSQPQWDVAPQWQRSSAVQGVYFHLEALRGGIVPAPSASHESWLEEKRRDGWRYGPVKRPDLKEHPCFVPYAELPPAQKVKDYLFGAIVKAYFDSGVEIEDDAR
jgi:hypothetical protein